MYARLLGLLLAALLFRAAQAQPSPPSVPRREGRLVRLARQIEPQLDGRADRLPQYVEFFQARMGNDPRLFAFDVQAAMQPPGRYVTYQAGIERFEVVFIQLSNTPQLTAADVEYSAFSIKMSRKIDWRKPEAFRATIGKMRVYSGATFLIFDWVTAEDSPKSIPDSLALGWIVIQSQKLRFDSGTCKLQRHGAL